MTIQKTRLAVLPNQEADAFVQMAEDALLLDCYPNKDQLRFRHYTWECPAFTFGYSQAYAWVRSRIGESIQVCRRMTGGGLVDHRRDWTYALVIPSHHPWYSQAASQTYRQVHETLAQALREIGQVATVPSARPSDVLPASSAIPTFCFHRAEPCDVIHPKTRQKIAGAALRRNRCGLLLQGSIEKSAAIDVKDWDVFKQAFIACLEQTLNASAIPVPKPSYPVSQVQAMYKRFASNQWNQRR